MSWNYRVIFHKAGQLKENPNLKWEEYLAIHEVYYDENGVPNSTTKDPITISGEEGKDSLVSIKWILEGITKALQKPILDYDNLNEIDKEKQNEFSKNIGEEN
jgi:hypothetical protein